jgi:hypothetical protein
VFARFAENDRLADGGHCALLQLDDDPPPPPPHAGAAGHDDPRLVEDEPAAGADKAGRIEHDGLAAGVAEWVDPRAAR